MSHAHRDDEQEVGRRPSRAEKWAERQERSRATRAELVELKASLDKLRDALDDVNRKPVAEEGGDDDGTQFDHFNQLPISQRTLLGLERGNYRKMTPIQRESLPLALTGHDILGAAKTGSGKTLCFVVPLLERLHIERWDAESGIGALVLSPTRELALQIFKVLQLVGYKHQFSAALLTGGRDVDEEKKRLHLISVVVGTPGRVLHHLRDGSMVSTDNLQLLIMDEADRLLDCGFRETLTGILELVPETRQTLLFSATQTTDVQMLAQMSLKNPRYVAAHILQSAAPTPSRLCQNFLVIELHRKLDALLMFLKRHPNDKIVVFVSTCNQVKYMYLAFSKILKKMRIPSMCLTSKMKQFRRDEVFLTYCRCKSAVLFCTDVASRGLDFPLVHWVIQYDCPDSAQTYIHRAGRTARAGARGVSLLFLTPSETPMLSYLHQKKVPLREIEVKPHLMNESKEIFVALVVQGLKYDAQKAFIAYLRSIFFAANKLVFRLEAIDVEKFAHSLGLLVVPNTSELQQIQRGAKNLPWDVVNYIAKQEQELQLLQKNDKDAAHPKAEMTRKERHLAASDQFRLLQVKQRYAAATTAGSGENGGGREVADEDDDDDSMGFLVKQKPTHKRGAAPVQKGTEPAGVGEIGDKPDSLHAELTFEERMAGLSKAKKRRLLQAADVKIKDLSLAKHVVFSDPEEEDNGGLQGDDGVHKDDPARRGLRVTSRRGEADPNLTPSSSSSDDEDFVAKMRRRVQQANVADAARMKALRRERQLKREGRLDRSGAAGASSAGGVQLRSRSPSSGSDDSGDDSGVDSDGSMAALLRAAKGELYDDKDDGSADEPSDEEREVERNRKPPAVGSRKRTQRSEPEATSGGEEMMDNDQRRGTQSAGGRRNHDQAKKRLRSQQ